MSLVSDERVEELLEIEAQAEKMRAEIERLRAALKAVVNGAYEMEYERGYMLTDHSYKAAVSVLSFGQDATNER